MSQRLTAATIGELGMGSAGLIINKAIDEAIADMDNRGSEDGKPRKVNIHLSLERRNDGNVEASVEVNWTAPKFRTPSHVCAPSYVKGELGLAFETISPARPDQRALPLGGEGEEAAE